MEEVLESLRTTFDYLDQRASDMMDLPEDEVDDFDVAVMAAAGVELYELVRALDGAPMNKGDAPVLWIHESGGWWLS